MSDFRDEDTFPRPSMPVVSEPRGYRLSGKIMLSAIVILFAVVIIMVCLHIYARWYLLRSRRRQIRRARRRTHLVFYIEPSNPANIVPITTRGLDAFVLKSLPTFIYKEVVEEEEVAECAVCLSEFEEGERGRILPKCNHSFHLDCIDMWFHSHSTCPICRSAVDLPAKEDSDSVGDVVVDLTESTRSQPGDVSESFEPHGPSELEPAVASSLGGRRKGLDSTEVSIQVPRRTQSFTFTNSDESGPSHAFKSPTSRILSLKRILSREKRSPTADGTSWCGGEESALTELDVELGFVESVSQSQTPR